MSMKVFNIKEYGAKFCDRLQTEKIQKAIDDCFLSGGGRVLIPCGVYLTGGFRLRSNVELYLEAGAIIKGSRDPEDYFAWKKDEIEPIEINDSLNSPSANPTSRWSNALIRVHNAKNVSIIGEKGSYFDGAYCFDEQGEQNYRGPHGMSIWNCENLKFEGYTFINCSNWCHAIFKSKNIHFDNVSIYGGCDGINIRTCDNTLIENCTINSGDDCVAGFDSNDVVVRDCILNTACMPLRMGGNNILVENCISNERNFGSRRWMTEEEKRLGNQTSERDRHRSHTCFSYYCDYRAVIRKDPGNIVIRNCHFLQEAELIRIEYDGRHRFCCNRGLHDILFENCTVREIRQVGMIWGKDVEKVSVHFKNVTMSCEESFEDLPLLVVGNFNKIIFEDCVIEGFNNPTILLGTDDEDKIEIIRSTPITIKKVTQEECFKAHRTGISSADFGKNESELNYY
ncbi:MAG: hypothetical protein E7347_04645 [Clostridiales bacterium]|nr:hypothetical protein [Clostridiales bacterium]